MRALYYPDFDVLEMRDLPDPIVPEEEVLLEVAACGLCGSELESFKNHSPRRKPPLVMGHEFCGKVIEVGRGVDGSLLGQKFVSNSLISCGACVRCLRGDTHLCSKRQLFGMHRPGAFASKVIVPLQALIPWPERLSAAEACLAEPLANGVHVVNLTWHIPVQTVLVIGAGPIGLMCQQAVGALRGAEVMICDLSEGRLAIARKLGAKRVVCSRQANVQAEVLGWTEQEGVDLVIDAAGSAATKQLSLACVRPGGAVVWIGLHSDEMQLKTYDITLPEKQIFGTYAAKKEELAQALELIRSGAVNVSSWVETIPLEESPAAFHRMMNPGDQDLKAVFIP